MTNHESSPRQEQNLPSPTQMVENLLNEYEITEGNVSDNHLEMIVIFAARIKVEQIASGGRIITGTDEWIPGTHTPSYKLDTTPENSTEEPTYELMKSDTAEQLLRIAAENKAKVEANSTQTQAAKEPKKPAPRKRTTVKSTASTDAASKDPETPKVAAVSTKRDGIKDLVKLDARGRAHYESGVKIVDKQAVAKLAGKFMSKHELELIEFHQNTIRDGLALRGTPDTAADNTVSPPVDPSFDRGIWAGSADKEATFQDLIKSGLTPEDAARTSWKNANHLFFAHVDVGDIQKLIRGEMTQPELNDRALEGQEAFRRLESAGFTEEEVNTIDSDWARDFLHSYVSAQDIRDIQSGTITPDEYAARVAAAKAAAITTSSTAGSAAAVPAGAPVVPTAAPQAATSVPSTQTVAPPARMNRRDKVHAWALLQQETLRANGERKVHKGKLFGWLGAVAVGVVGFGAVKGFWSAPTGERTSALPVHDFLPKDSNTLTTVGSPSIHKIPSASPLLESQPGFDPKVSASDLANQGGGVKLPNVAEAPSDIRVRPVGLKLAEGDSIWGKVNEYLDTNNYPTDDVTIDTVKDAILRKQGLSEQAAANLPVGYKFSIPPEVLEQLNKIS